MTHPLPMPRRIAGVDFSGAQDAGRKLWITEGRSAGGRLYIEACASIAQRCGGVTAPAESCAALVAFLRRLGAAAVGCDFPFSLPNAMIGKRDWPAFLAGFARRYPTAETLHQAGRRGGKELRRTCDIAAKTPFAPTNLRLYRQTWRGIRDVLAPLTAADAARVLPFQKPRPGVPWLLECCPASALKCLGMHQPPYKGGAPGRAARRAAILRELEEHGVAPLSGSLRRVVIGQAGGDALDSVIAAWIAFRVVTRPGGLPSVPPRWPAIEGLVYSGFPITDRGPLSIP